MSRPQKGRKPWKNWHKHGQGGKQARATQNWPVLKGVAYDDGAPIPLRQGISRRDRSMWSL